MDPIQRQPASLIAAILAIIGRIMLTALFIINITPAGLALRILGIDLLRLRRPRAAATYWHKAKPPSPLERLY